MPGTSAQRFAQLPLSAAELEQLTKRLRTPKSYTQLAADRMQFGEVLRVILGIAIRLRRYMVPLMTYRHYTTVHG